MTTRKEQTFELKTMKYQNLERLLKATIEIVKEKRARDRVFIFSQNRTVMAELAVRWISTLAVTTKVSNIATHPEADCNNKLRAWKQIENSCQLLKLKLA